jgi:outer membrane lipoprotein-sorting protein
MIRWMREALWAAAVAFGVLLAAPSAKAASNEQLSEEQLAVVKKLGDYFNSLTTMKGEFTQVSPKGNVSAGVFYISKPGKMRFEYAPPNPFIIVSDGRWVTVKNNAKNKADQYPLSATPLNLMLAKQVDLLKEAKILSVEEKSGVFWVTLESKDSLVPGQLVLVYDPQNSALQQWIVVDGQGRKTTVNIAKIEPGVEPDPKLFEIEVPKRRLKDE